MRVSGVNPPNVSHAMAIKRRLLSLQRVRHHVEESNKMEVFTRVCAVLTFVRENLNRLEVDSQSENTERASPIMIPVMKTCKDMRTL